MSVIVPPDENCNLAYQQIIAIAHAHALVIDSNEISIVIAPPEAQRDLEIREEVLEAHCMVELTREETAEELLRYQAKQWPERKGRGKSVYKKSVNKPVKLVRPLREVFFTEKIRRFINSKT